MCNRDAYSLCRSEVSRLIFYSSPQLAVVVASSTMVAARHSLTDFRAASQTCSYLMQVCWSRETAEQFYSSAWYFTSSSEHLLDREITASH